MVIITELLVEDNCYILIKINLGADILLLINILALTVANNKCSIVMSLIEGGKVLYSPLSSTIIDK